MVSGSDRTSPTAVCIDTPGYNWASMLLLICISVLLLPVTPQAEQGAISKYRSKLDRLQENIADQQEKIAEGKGKEKDTLEELDELEASYLKQQQRLEELEVQVVKQEILLESKKEALATIAEKSDGVERHLLKRITAYYTMGDLGLLNVTFSSKSLPELLTFRDAFDNLIAYDNNLLNEYKQSVDELERAQQALHLEKGILEDFHKQAEAEQLALVETQKHKHILLTHIRTQSQLHQQSIEEMQEASKKLVDSIVSIKSVKENRENVFLRQKGKLTPPVKGRLTTRFQEEKTSKFGVLKKYQGIELQAPDGMKITAVSGGLVIYSGYLRGYGNTIIIHHGYQYYTVISRIEKIISKKGQRVEAGQTIGLVGDTATLFDEGLYFEIRHGRKSLDPLLWLDPTNIVPPEQ